MSSCRGLPVWSLALIQRQCRNESLFNLFFPIRPIWSLLAIVPETAGGVLNSENEIRWPTGKKLYWPGSSACGCHSKFSDFLKQRLPDFFSRGYPLFSKKYLLIDFRTKLPSRNLLYMIEKRQKFLIF